MKRNFIMLNLIFAFTTIFAQDIIVKPEFITYPIDSITKRNINQTLESLFLEIGQGIINPNYLTSKRRVLTTTILEELMRYETRKDSSLIDIKDKQLINIFPISNNQYLLSISYSTQHNSQLPKLIYIINLMATENQGKITFSIPLDYLTRYWKTQKIGNITYHFRKQIDNNKAETFNRNNQKIANKLDLQPEMLDFYMCDNYQEISTLLGKSYSIHSNGQYRDGYGVDSKTIFSIMNNEDFSHDMFHYYSSNIHKRENRNWIAEEGIAYSWGNAYYTDNDGEMISHHKLVNELKNYISKNPNTDLFELFSKDVNIFDHIAPDISVRSTISGLIINSIEKEKGIDGILKLINAGSKDRLNSYLKVTEELIGLNKDNFNSTVERFLYNP
ncbi:hypothetical protein [Psychroserpens ponticola]|uniref:DUF4835 family protein n=1 Tax=Psychroserpens ponticola TaxID=2932268 RepID=A0ABY7RV98_9FLAO|nr:hypothetical protein [Psychroserpens ponticola]WCO01045.1 hypothetical protein MUN68_013345 [Psychroserpens ponticola]